MLDEHRAPPGIDDALATRFPAGGPPAWMRGIARPALEIATISR